MRLTAADLVSYKTKTPGLTTRNTNHSPLSSLRHQALIVVTIVIQPNGPKQRQPARKWPGFNRARPSKRTPRERGHTRFLPNALYNILVELRALQRKDLRRLLEAVTTHSIQIKIADKIFYLSIICYLHLFECPMLSENATLNSLYNSVAQPFSHSAPTRSAPHCAWKFLSKQTYPQQILT